LVGSFGGHWGILTLERFCVQKGFLDKRFQDKISICSGILGVDKMWKTCRTMGMEVDRAALWTSVCGELEVSMSPAIFLWWVKPCFIKDITDIDDERVIVSLATPSAYHLHHVDERYYGQIKQALEKQLLKKCELALTVEQRGVSGQRSAVSGQQEEREKFGEGSLFATQAQPTVVETKGMLQRYVFDTFVVGGSNALAYAAAKAVVEYPGSRHNPLFIYGGVGVGKTHLMQAVGHALAAKGIRRVAYLTSEQFTNDLVNSLRMKTVDAFKKKYREVGALLVDDVQFFAGKESTQEEFFHTFNHLYMNGVQIVMTSDRKPQEIEKLEERLVSRFLGGLTVDNGMPDYEIRVAILRQKSSEMKSHVPNEVINMIAANVMTNARELEGVFVRLINESYVNGGVITPELLEKVLGVKAKQERSKLRPIQIISVVAKHFEMKNKDLVGKSRKADLVLARHIAIYLLRVELQLQLTKVGDLFGTGSHDHHARRQR
jgi:chromosomal replication initiator protein